MDATPILTDTQRQLLEQRERQRRLHAAVPALLNVGSVVFGERSVERPEDVERWLRDRADMVLTDAALAVLNAQAMYRTAKSALAVLQGMRMMHHLEDASVALVEELYEVKPPQLPGDARDPTIQSIVSFFLLAVAADHCAQPTGDG